MLLLRLSGHSCAGKTRLVNLLPRFGISYTKVIRHTSRVPRIGEKEGEDYFFRSREFIESLPEKDFLVGPVRNMLQAFDLRQIGNQLRNNPLVIIEIYPSLWPLLIARLKENLGEELFTASVFMTAVDPAMIRKFRKKEEKTGYITSEVYKMLLFRNKDEIADIKIRAGAAAGEVLEALGPAGSRMYDKIIVSTPEGPDGDDDWTRDLQPAGKAASALQEFIALIKNPLQESSAR